MMRKEKKFTKSRGVIYERPHVKQQYFQDKNVFFTSSCPSAIRTRCAETSFLRLETRLFSSFVLPVPSASPSSSTSPVVQFRVVLT